MILPPLPIPPSANLLLFSTQQWNWIVNTMTIMYTADDAILQSLGSIINALEKMQVTMDDLGHSLDTHDAKITELVEAGQHEIQEVKDAIMALGTRPTPEQIAAVKARVEASTSKLDDLLTAFKADDAPSTP